MLFFFFLLSDHNYQVDYFVAMVCEAYVSVSIIHRTLDVDYRIFNVRRDVNACDCTRGCTDIKNESALKVDSGKKIPGRTGNQTYVSGVTVRCSTN